MQSSTCFLALLAATAQAGKTGQTHAVLRFTGDGPLMEGRIDPVNTPGRPSGHVHAVMGGSNMGISATGESLMQSKCSSATVRGDNSGYWVPKLYFRDSSGTVEPVELWYFNAYYFFEPTDDNIVAFPVGLQIHSGDLATRRCSNAGGTLQVNGANASTIQPTQWTCPRSGYQPPSWPSAQESDGSTKGIQDPNNQQAGQGFPDANCDGYGSPLRQDVHFPSCYDPSKSLDDHEHNMVFPTLTSDWKQNCPKGYIHVPHLFYEAYWNTPAFAHRWTPFQGQQPFVLADGDATGCSAHGDFMAAWDTSVLQHIIDTCDAKEAGMDHCSGITPKSKSDSCNIESPIQEQIYGKLNALPGNNPIVGWGQTNPATNAKSSDKVDGQTGPKYGPQYASLSSPKYGQRSDSSGKTSPDYGSPKPNDGQKNAGSKDASPESSKPSGLDDGKIGSSGGKRSNTSGDKAGLIYGQPQRMVTSHAKRSTAVPGSLLGFAALGTTYAFLRHLL